MTQSAKIARILGGRPPEGFNYEMFLDEKGEKISKSKGNGLSLEEWLRYGSEESLAFYIYREPKRAKSLHIGVIPRAVDFLVFDFFIIGSCDVGRGLTLESDPGH